MSLRTPAVPRGWPERNKAPQRLLRICGDFIRSGLALLLSTRSFDPAEDVDVPHCAISLSVHTQALKSCPLRVLLPARSHHRPEPGGKRRSTFLFLDLFRLNCSTFRPHLCLIATSRLADVQQEHEPGRFGRIGQRRQEVHHLVALHLAVSKCRISLLWLGHFLHKPELSVEV